MAEIEFREDAAFYPTMLELAAQLDQEIDRSGLPDVDVKVLPGNLAVLDDACDDHGQGWVLAVRAFATTDFPNADTTGTCGVSLAMELQVGVARCVPTFGDEQGSAPSMEDELEAARLQMADMMAMRRAICATFAKLKNVDWRLGGFNVLTSSGGVGGGAWTVIVQQPTAY